MTDFPDRLSIMFYKQQAMQTDTLKDYRYSVTADDLATMTQEQLISQIDAIKTAILGLTDELHEALSETGWKPWASSKHINRDAVVGELVDAWHFLMMLFLLVGAGPDELWSGYLKKIMKNQARQKRGYDGVSDKCGACGRAMDDDTTGCVGTAKDPATGAWTSGICAEYGRYGL